MKLYSFEVVVKNGIVVLPYEYLDFKTGMRDAYNIMIKNGMWQYGNALECFRIDRGFNELVFRVEKRFEGDIVSEVRKSPLREGFEYRFNFKTLKLQCIEN